MKWECVTHLRHVAIDGELLVGALPAKQYKPAVAWLVLHEDELYKAWNEAVSGRPFN